MKWIPKTNTQSSPLTIEDIARVSTRCQNGLVYVSYSLHGPNNDISPLLADYTENKSERLLDYVGM